MEYVEQILLLVLMYLELALLFGQFKLYYHFSLPIVQACLLFLFEVFFSEVIAKSTVSFTFSALNLALCCLS